MNKSRFLTFFLILTIWLSTTGFTPLHLNAVQTAANALVPIEAFAPAAFGKTSPVNNTAVLTSQVQLVWQASTPGVTYEYCIFTKANCPPGQWKTAAGSTSVTVNLKPSSVYTWQVRARAGDGTITYADGGTSWKFTTGSAAPTGFTKASPSNGLTNQPINPTLTWTASTGLNVNYQICVDTVSNNTCDGTWLQVGTGTSYTLNGLDYNKPYYWQVRAYNSKGTVYADGSATSFWSFTTRIAPPTPFVKLTPQDGAVSMPVNLTLAWSPSTGTALSYQYCLVTVNPGTGTCENSGGTWVSTGENTFAAIGPLDYQTTYYWQVRALNNNNSDDSVQANSGAWWSFNTLVSNPQGFTKLLPADLATAVSITPYLYWSAALGTSVAYEYCVKAGAASTCDPESVTDWKPVTGTNTYVQVPELQRNTTYVWQVRAQAAGVSGYTYADAGAHRQFTTIPEAPVALPPQSFETQEDTLKTGQLNATNPGARTLIFTLSGREPANKSFLLASTGEFTFTPVQDFNGSVTFDYTIWDGVNLPSGPYTATITVTPENDTPVIDPVADVTVFTGGDIFFTIQTMDADLQYGDTITISLTGTLPSGATFTLATDPTTHAASADFDWPGAVWTAAHPGPYTFTVKATDSLGAFSEDTFTITVTSYTTFLPIVMK